MTLILPMRRGQAPAGGGWDISTAVFNQSFSISDGVVQSVFFSPDGLKMYVNGGISDGVYEYDLSSAWDISTASFSNFLDLTGQEAGPNSSFFSPDGTKMYVTGGVTNDAVYEYDLGTAWLTSTASFNQLFSTATQDTQPNGSFFRDDGLKMYIVGNENDSVHEYDLSVAWDISTAVFSQSFDVSSEETSPLGFFFKPDGLKMYVTGEADNVHEYDLSVAWDISTAMLNQSLDVAAQDNRPNGVFFRDDGLKMYIAGNQNDDIYEYDLG